MGIGPKSGLNIKSRSGIYLTQSKVRSETSGLSCNEC